MSVFFILFFFCFSCGPLHDIKRSSAAHPTLKWEINRSLDWHFDQAKKAGLSDKQAAKYAIRKVAAGMAETPLSDIKRIEGMRVMPYIRGRNGL